MSCPCKTGAEGDLGKRPGTREAEIVDQSKRFPSTMNQFWRTKWVMHYFQNPFISFIGKIGPLLMALRTSELLSEPKDDEAQWKEKRSN